MIIIKLQEAFGQTTNEPTTKTTKKPSQISRLLFAISGKSQVLLDAVKDSHASDVKDALQRNAYVDTTDN